MATQFTLGIIKPDVFRRVNSVQVIENIFSIFSFSFSFSNSFCNFDDGEMINNQGLNVVKHKQHNLTLQEAEAFYAEHRGKFFYPRLVSSMTRYTIPPYMFFFNFENINSGPVLTFILKKENAIADWRSLMGPTHAAK
jgi:nucleoside diphosphate kinase